MNYGTRVAVRGLLIFSILLLMGSFAAAQKNKPSAPAPKAAAPRAPASHAAPAQHANTAHAAPRTGTSTAGHGGATAGRTGSSTTARGNTATGRGNTTAGHTTTAGRGNTATAGHGNTTAAHGNTGAAHGNTAAAHGNTAGAHGNAAGAHGGPPKGGTSRTDAHGNTRNFNKGGRATSVRTKGGAEGHFDRRGHVSSIHAHGMTINHGAHGERRFETRRRDGGRLVGYGHGRGFAERGYYRGGRPYMRRSYFYGGHSYAYAYRGAYWHGVAFYGYVPPVYFGVGFYGWAYNPWPAPVAWGWGWGAAPWYGFYGAYFAPAPVYPYPSLWLADYLLAANLQAAYDARAATVAAANAAAANAAAADANDQQADDSASNAPATLSPEVKQAIADEVKAQLAAEKEDASRPAAAAASNANTSSASASIAPTSEDQLPAALDPKHTTFVVSATLNEPTDDGTECSLTAGDVLTRIQNTPDADQNVRVLVSSGQKGDCSSGSQVTVAVQDLQDMYNDFHAKMDDGLSKMADNQGKNGMPKGPAPGKKTNPDGQAQPDLTVAADLKAQDEDATKTEKEVQDASSSGGSGSGGGNN